MSEPSNLPSIEDLHRAYRYDPETGLLYSRCPRYSQTPIGGVKNRGYKRIQHNGKDLLVHRIVWAMHYGEWPTSMLDHVDRDKLNNRISNLRLATPSQNIGNTAIKGSLPAKGIGFEKSTGRYFARIKFNGKDMRIGTYGTIDEAAHAYNKAAIKYFGEFACLNPIGVDK